MRERVLDTAYAILQESGPESLTVREIAERLDVAHMSLYTYFDSHAAIVRALRERELAKWRARQSAFDQQVQTEAIPQVVSDVLEAYITFARENPHLYRLAWVLPELGGESGEENHQRMQATVGHLARLLKLGMDAGAFRPREPYLAACTVLGMINMPFILFHSGKLVDPVSRDQMVEEVRTAAMLYLTQP